jgi:short-subunit dehydrogenase
LIETGAIPCGIARSVGNRTDKSSYKLKLKYPNIAARRRLVHRTRVECLRVVHAQQNAEMNMRENGTNGFAIVTGASTGIGLELAKCCAKDGYDLLIVADEPEINEAAEQIKRFATNVETLEADLSTTDGVDKLYSKIGDRPVAALLANAGRGLGKGFLDQDFDEVRRVVDTNITGTIYLIHKIGNDMRRRGGGKILITGSIAGFMPGSFQAVYNGTKAFIDSFSWALRNELKDSGVSVTCLMPGVTDTEFFDRAGMSDTKVGAGEKMDADEVAKIGFDAMMKGEGDVVAGWKNKLQAAIASVTPSAVLAEQHRKMAEPGTGQH